MRPSDNTPTHQYELVSWTKPTNPYKHVKVLTLTEHEAHEINRGYAINGNEKRYVRRG
jgi:hypothetical protein